MDWDRSLSLTSCLLSRFTCGIFRRSTFFELLPPEPAGCRNLHLGFEKIHIFLWRRVEIARGICWGPPGLHDARYNLSASLRWNRLCLNADCHITFSTSRCSAPTGSHSGSHPEIADTLKRNVDFLNFETCGSHWLPLRLPFVLQEAFSETLNLDARPYSYYNTK